MDGLGAWILYGLLFAAAIFGFRLLIAYVASKFNLLK